ncbi:MAG: hypothetical protein KIS92_12625 [Planctomycetota bacterium]|nr:hypothetical protein [Planctomycetota bacterium]
MPDTPYLSIVATSRNDNHGETLTRRMQVFVNALAAQCEKFELPAELILVEWNPPDNRPSLFQELSWPAGLRHLQIRIVAVPASEHLKFGHAKNLPLFQMIAKNVGIRRARAPFVMATNIDIVFNDQLFHFLASRKLQKDKMYRIDRHDISTDIPSGASIQEQLAFCDSNILRVNAREATIPTTPAGQPLTFEGDICPLHSGIAFNGGWYDLKHEGAPYRYMRSGAEIQLTPSSPLYTGLHVNIEPGFGVRNFGFYLSVIDESGKTVARGFIFGRHYIFVKLPLVAGKTQTYRLIVEGGGLPSPDTGHVIDAKVRYCNWTSRKDYESSSQFQNMVPELVPLPFARLRKLLGKEQFAFDITRATDGISLVSNWHTFEIKDGRYARWVNNDAVFSCVNSNHKSRTLLLELEPGPGFYYDSFVLQVLDEDDRVVAERAIESNEKRKNRYLRNMGREHAIPKSRRPENRSLKAKAKGALSSVFFHQQILLIDLPLAPDSINYFKLRAVYRGELRIQDPIYMGFRVYRCQWRTPFEKELSVSRSQEKSFLEVGLNTASTVKKYSSVHQQYVQQIADVHTNACGDFTLISKEGWEAIRGYPEIEMYSMHIDSLGCYAAVAAGIDQELIEDPCRIFHIEHGKGSGWTPEGEQKLFARMKEKGIPVLDFPQLIAWSRQMYRHGPIEFNDAHWGLGNVDLAETQVG